MAEEIEEQRMSLAQEEDKNDLVSSSDSDNSDHEEEAPPQVEWLATTREKRSTAGNRMKSMLAAEEPDDELELLFAEDADDAGFSDVDGGDSDVQMDSSSDEEDAQAQDDEDEGEKELQKQLRDRKLAARKRKAQDAIPAKFRKKVRVDPTPTDSSATTPAPRPKKKSERASWLPTSADLPTRASKRETTMLSKEALHQQMVEREAKRLKQVEAMERKAKRMEALKKPPMTQAERLAEAAKVEKRNAKSLNRWEEAEKQREEERKAKLAALNNRQLNGPVLTFWSGMGEWVDGKLKYLGKSVVVEDKVVKKRLSTIGTDKLPETSDQANSTKNEQDQAINTPAGSATITTSSDQAVAVSGNLENDIDKGSGTKEPPEIVTDADLRAEKDNNSLPQQPGTLAKPEQRFAEESQAAQPETHHLESIEQEQKAPGARLPDSDSPHTANSTLSPVQQQTKSSTTSPTQSTPSAPPPVQQQTTSSVTPVQSTTSAPPPSQATTDTKLSDMRPPSLQTPSSSPYTTSMFAPPSQPHAPVMKPPEMKPPPNSYLAPPPGATKRGLSMPVLGYSPSAQPSNVLSPSSTTQRQSPLSMPQADAHAPPPPASTTRPAPQPPQMTSKSPSIPVAKPQTPQVPTPTKALGTLKHANASKKAKDQPSIPDLPPLPRPPPPPNMKATCNSMILQNFDEHAIEQKSVQQRILFGKETGKLASKCTSCLFSCLGTDKSSQNKHHHRNALSRINRHATRIPKQVCHIMTLEPIRRYRNYRGVTTNGVNWLAHGSELGLSRRKECQLDFLTLMPHRRQNQHQSSRTNLGLHLSRMSLQSRQRRRYQRQHSQQTHLRHQQIHRQPFQHLQWLLQ